jgi:sigma-E factor negative regulatory protein RseA
MTAAARSMPAAGAPAAPTPTTPDDRGERWSCLMDGEADADQIKACLDEWRASEGARADWGLWHAAGDALRSSEVASWHAEGFTARLSHALAAEPAIVAPRRRGLRLVRRVVLPGAAVAAAAAMLTVAVLPVLRGADDGMQMVQSQRVAPVPAVATDATLVRVERLPQMDQYIAAHREMAGSLGLPRTSPYLRTTTVLPER